MLKEIDVSIFWSPEYALAAKLNEVIRALNTSEAGKQSASPCNSDYAAAISEIGFVLNGNDGAESKLRFINEIIVRLNSTKAATI